jgi:DNA polymerase III delta prime subunit
MNDESLPWILKYAPKNVDEMILTDDLKTVFRNIINSKTLTNISIFGDPGIGKTTLSKILVSFLDCEYLFHPCSMDGSIDTVKTSIKNFCDIVSGQKYKVIILDEADQLSQTAQMALRNIIVDSAEKCRFILTANYQDKIINALKSRCAPIKLEFSIKDILKYCVNILKNEKIKYTKESLLEFYSNIIVKKYPDVRTIIEHLQMMSVSGTLNILKKTELNIENEIIKYIYENIKSKDIRDIREFLISNEDKFSSDYVSLAQELFNVYDSNVMIMTSVADALWRMSFQLDKEIQFTGLLINIKDILNKSVI